MMANAYISIARVILLCLISSHVQASTVEEVAETTAEVATAAPLMSENAKNLAQCAGAEKIASMRDELFTSTKNATENAHFKLLGQAKFSVLFWDIYNSTLYTESGSYLHEVSTQSLIFEIEYLKDITKNDLLERTIEQWQHLRIPESQYSKFIPRLKVIWPDISSGDKLAMLVKNKQSVFFFNNLRIGQIEQKEFSKLFLDIWLSPRTSQIELRKQLLGGRG